MKLIGNLIWVLFGGIFIALEYFIASLVLMITIVGIPFGLQTMKLAGLALWPFQREVINKGKEVSALSTLMNILWILCGGIWISLSHLFFGLIFVITIIGIPFGLQHFKLAGLALMPFGKTYK